MKIAYANTKNPTKRDNPSGLSASSSKDILMEASKPSALYQPKHARLWTLSIAVPGSIIANALTHDQKTALAGQIARACAVFCVDEVVVYNDGQVTARPHELGGYSAYADPDFFLFHVMSYLETPPHLRKLLFRMHPDLRSAGALPSLDMPHHLRADEWCPYREGFVVKQDIKGCFSLINCGIANEISVPASIDEGTRVTVKLPEQATSLNDLNISGEAVAPDTPRVAAGYYWGYDVRRASSLSTVFTECPFDGGYDVSIGTSERGRPLTTLVDSANSASLRNSTWRHLLLVFGGVGGLEAALAGDPELSGAGVVNVRECFDEWINLVPGQGSRTIRTEEAIWLGLMGIAPFTAARA